MSDNYWTRARGAACTPEALPPGMRDANRIARRHFLQAVAAAAGTGVLIACGGGKNEGAQEDPGQSDQPRSSQAAAPAPSVVPKGGTLIATVIATDAKSFHPYLTTDTVSSTYQAYVYGAGLLTRRDPETLELAGNAAERWTVSDDNKTYTFKLTDIKWSDGVPMTAEDYV